MLTPTEKVQQWMLFKATGQRFDTREDIDREWNGFMEWDDWQDHEAEVRGGQFVTDVPAPHSRHYEAKSVAAQMLDGSYVGWTYWYGGGKHGEPESVPWMEDAYELDMREEKVVVKKFTKRDRR